MLLDLNACLTEYLQALDNLTISKRNKTRTEYTLCLAMASAGKEKVDIDNIRVYRYGDKLKLYEARDKINHDSKRSIAT